MNVRFFSLVLIVLVFSVALAQSTLEAVRGRQELICGVSGLQYGDLVKQSDGGVLGFHSGICQAVAAITLGDSSKVLYVPVLEIDAFAQLSVGNVDLLVGNTDFSVSNDLTYDIHFGPTVFYFEKLPYAPAVQHDDDVWLDIVTWTVYALMQAEEWGLSSVTVEDVFNETENPKIIRFLERASGLDERLGISGDAFLKMIKQVGNYAELYERHLGPSSGFPMPRGMNELYLNGGLHYSPPFD